MKSVSLIILFLSLLKISVFSQQVKEDTVILDLSDFKRQIENRISFQLPEMKYRVLELTTGKKIVIKPDEVVINGDTIHAKKVNTRGQSTLLYKRKSLSFHLKSEAAFYHGEARVAMKRFKLLSLSMDKYYCHNRIAFELMEHLDLDHLFYSFCELQINDHSEGIFMVVERPEDWALKKKNSPLVIRRGPKHSIDEITTDDMIDKTERKKYVTYYREIYKALYKYEGEELYETLKEYLDIDFYMTWIAFNFLVHNGDYADEVFFYIDPETNRFRIIPWDYDDILVSAPHEGLKQRNLTIGDKLLFSGEDILDITIAKDPYLYQVYRKHLKEVLETISPELLKAVIEETFAELYPYYLDYNIISNVHYDAYKDASVVTLKSYLNQIYHLLYDYRKAYLEYLE